MKSAVVPLIYGLGLAVGAVNGFSFQQPFAFEESSNPSLLDKAIESLGFEGSHIKESLSSELKKIWEEIPLRFPSRISNLEFVSQPRPGSLQPKTDWDFTVRSEDVQNYQLRLNKIADPKLLGIDPDVKQYSGYLDVEEEDKHFFFYAFESRNDPKKDPVVLWLNGGPGCSSLTGLFFELGPSSINSDLKPVYNPFSWNSNATVIFLDQPVNVGYSYSSKGVFNTVAAGKDVYSFLQLFFKQFPEYNSGQTFHIAGESYAGHYIPDFASEILSHPKEEGRIFNLDSVLIGNGLTDPLNQYPHYRPMACGDGGEPAVLGPDECQAMDDSLGRCLGLIESCYDTESVWTCVPAAIYCNNAELAPFQQTGKNVYDVRKECKGNLCYDDMQYSEEYLNLDYVKRALGAEVDNYESCNFDINRNFLFAGDWMKPFVKGVTNILNQGLPVLVYAGDKDFICNWLGNKAWTDVLPWKEAEGFSKAQVRPWKASLTGEKAGELKSFAQLSYLRVYDGGHMVPYDQPENSLSMLNEWIHQNYSLQTA